MPSQVQADMVLKNQGVGEFARAQRAGVQGAGVSRSCAVSGQVGSEASLRGEGTTTQLTRERALSQMRGLVQAQRSGAAEDSQTHSTLISSLGARQRMSSHGRARDSLAGTWAQAEGSQHFPAIGAGSGGQVVAVCVAMCFSEGLCGAEGRRGPLFKLLDKALQLGGV